MNIILVFLLALSVSADAFSMSLAYGTCIKRYKETITLSIIEGFFHFSLSIIGVYIGSLILSFLHIKSSILTLILFLLIGISMIIESFKKEKKIKDTNLFRMIIFGFTVSIDSFTIGIGLKEVTKYPLLASVIFGIFSTIAAFIGLNLGSKLNKKIGKLSTILGGVIIIILSFVFLFY